MGVFHKLRTAGLFTIILLGVVAAVAHPQTHTGQVLGYATNVSVADVNTLSNAQRTKNGLPALVPNAALSSAASAKAADMIANNYWAHNSPSGATPWSFVQAAGYNYHTAGENLAKNFDTSDAVVTAWMNSPGHRANILNTTYQDVGYAVVNGTLLGEQTTLVVAEYGSPSGSSARTAVVPPKPEPSKLAPTPTPSPSLSATSTTSPSAKVHVPAVSPLPPNPTKNDHSGVVSIVSIVVSTAVIGLFLAL